MQDTEIQKSSRQYKDTLFRTLFGDEKRFLELYNAVADDNFPDDTVVTPCPSNSLLARFNDLAACIGSQLVVFFEHQSTPSKNMPLRLLPYATDVLYSHIVEKDRLYGSEQILIPTPKFFVLYNGEQKLTERVVKLSDSFVKKDDSPSLELTAKIIDINFESEDSAIVRSSSLKGYAYLIAEIRKNLRTSMNRDMAIVTAIESCIKQDVLQTFLTENYMEVVKMLNYEYDADAEKRVLKQEGRKEGIQEGIQEGHQNGRQEVIDFLADLSKAGVPFDVALAEAKKSTQSINPPQ